MTRAELTAYLMDIYSTKGVYLFAKHPGFLVDMRYELTNGRG